MRENLPEKVAQKVTSSLNSELELIADAITHLSEIDDDGKSVDPELAYAAAFYTVCALLDKGKIIIVERDK